ncbi:hypothetical protein F4809DRAFT_534566 [Biscogniauxia mediterranea]|nr:hypothetical protein F4809DRAFT_534566 [Biscogniauxia mediterranea]
MDTAASQTQPKGILKRRSSLDLRLRGRSSSAWSTSSSSSYSSSASSASSAAFIKKTAAFDDVARDIMTGDEVPQSPMSGSEYRAWHKGYRQETGRALLLAHVDSMYEDLLKRVEEKRR